MTRIADTILARPARLGPVRLVAVDGPSGAGKTVFAAALARALEQKGASVGTVHTDDLLDGWADQLTFWPRLEAQILVPLRAGRPGEYRRYDWQTGAFGMRAHLVPVSDVVIVEGVTSARAAIRAELTYSVFVTAPPEVCVARAIGRDGEAIREPLERWRRGEAEFFAADGTQTAVDLVIEFEE